MTGSQTVTVFDRHRLVAEAIASGLTSRGVRAMGLALSQSSDPPPWLAVGDVVVLDAGIGWSDVQRWLATCRAQGVGARVVLVTDGAAPVSELTARRAGAWGWFARKATLGTAAMVVRRVLDGGPLFVVHGPAPALPESRQPLTSREQEVLAEIAAGVSYAEIASRLRVSHNTVRTHATSIRTKLGVRSRSAAVAVAHGVRIDGPPRQHAR